MEEAKEQPRTYKGKVIHLVNYSFGRHVAEARVLRRFSHRDLLARANVTSFVITNIEHNFRSPWLCNAVFVADALGVRLLRLLQKPALQEEDLLPLREEETFVTSEQRTAFKHHRNQLVNFTFGSRIAEARKLRGWSQRELGAKAGITGKVIVSVEYHFKHIYLENAVFVASALGVSLARLLQNEPVTPSDLIECSQ